MGYSFTIQGIEPPDFQLRPERAQRAFWKTVVAIALVVKDEELAAGKGVNGRPLKPISAYTRKHRKSWTGVADPNAPPLTPAYAASRTRFLLDGRALKDRAEFFWRDDPITGKHWGRILGYHRDGAGRLPVRDVIGISRGGLTRVRKEAWKDWEKIKRGEDARARVKRGLSVPQAPARIEVTGRIDLQHAVYSTPGSQARVADALARGQHTGFRQKRIVGGKVVRK